ncbi:unnamed protein product [Cylindrotheca closterium]|uniref:Uncharacterized protein n=1 Tax=Cylindrotheca closterium TaxID=2856 RepID=A0AAD2JKG7_9STRA|nr:unnamed protein product [Cylindrotheca closterium]
MAAGQNLLEEEDIISTNPLFLTNREAALSPKGIAQVQEACLFLEQNQINPSVIKYSLAASSMDTTAIVKDALRVGQNRLIPEFTFMDPRGIGKWDTMSYSQTLPAIFALDETEAGKDGKQGRPPPNDDGTPNETLAEQKIRLVQLISVLETQFQGDTVLLIFPDGSTPALLSCMMAGIPFNKVHELEFAPGEVRLHQDMANIQTLYETRQQQSALNREYEKTVQLGKVELERLRGLDPATIVSKKDLKLQKEVAEVEEQQRQRDEQRRIKAEKEEEARILRYKTIEEARAKKEQAAALQRMSQSGGASEGGDKSTQIAIGSVTSLAVVAGLAIGGQSDTDPVAAVSSGSAAMRNETFAGPLNATTTTTTSGVQSATRAAATANAPTRASNATTRVQSLPDTLPQTILPVGDAAASNKKSLYSDPVPTKENKEEAAAKAMEDYMNQDDGGDDWLTVMGQLMEEDETGEDGQDIIDEWQ